MNEIVQLEAELEMAYKALYSLPPIDDPIVSIHKDFWSAKIGRLKREIGKTNGIP